MSEEERKTAENQPPPRAMSIPMDEVYQMIGELYFRTQMMARDMSKLIQKNKELEQKLERNNHG